MRYQFLFESHIHAEVRMTHVFLDMKTKSKTAMPEIVRDRLQVYYDAQTKV